jgi:hypothetical protein
MTRREWIALAAAGTLVKADAMKSILGDGWGLDHFLIALADPGSVSSIFVTKLGFTIFPGGVKSPSGDENAVIRLGPQFMELLWFYDRKKAMGSGDEFSKLLLRTADQGGGPVGYVIDIAPIERIAAELRERGMKVDLPQSRTILREGKEVTADWQFLTISDTGHGASERGVPGGADAGFIDYGSVVRQRILDPGRTQRHRERAEKEFPDPRRRAGEVHPNTARRMRSVWVAVSSVSDALKQAELFGFAAVAEHEDKLLGARGREVQCGLGAIIFWESVKPGAPLAALIKQKGVGPFGLSIEVADLKVAHQIIEDGMHKKFPFEGSRKSFIVPAELTAGTWIEFAERPRA